MRIAALVEVLEFVAAECCLLWFFLEGEVWEGGFDFGGA